MINVSESSGVPIYRQIVTQVAFLIETGELNAGERLPSSRMLADNLGINRNTVAHAYRELRDQGLVEPRGRGGMIVIENAPLAAPSEIHEQAASLIEAAVRDCLQLGLPPRELDAMLRGIADRELSKQLDIAFVECNREGADDFSMKLTEHLGMAVSPLVLGEFEAPGHAVDLVVTTFFHFAEVRELFSGTRTEVVAIVVAPHVQTLVQIARVPKNREVGLWYRTEDQALSIRDSLSQAGITNVRMIDSIDGDELAKLDMLIVPSGMQELRSQLEQMLPVIEFGNVLDVASKRMVSQVVQDLKRAKYA